MEWRRLCSKLTDEISVVLMRSPLLRVVFFDRWFRLILVILFVGALGLALYFPRIWRMTPAGLAPEVKVSALDLTQAWSLKRSARAAANQKQFELSNRCWQSALANNAADREAIRGFLGNFLAMDQPDLPTRTLAIGQCFWLQHLGETNRAALELVFKVYARIGDDGLLITMVERDPALLPKIPNLKADYLKALLRSGQVANFHQHYLKADDALRENLRLYELARVAGWDSGPDSLRTRRELEDMAALPTASGEILELHLLVCDRLEDPNGYERSLRKLESLNRATPRHHVRHWKLLNRRGRVEEARAAARFRSVIPNTPSEFVALARVYGELQIQEEGRQVLKNALPAFSRSHDAWIAYGSVLQDCKDWPELRHLARTMRQDRHVGTELKGYSYFLEGYVEASEGRMPSAQSLFAESVQRKINGGWFALIAANELLRFGFPELAIGALAGHEREMAGIHEYWEMLFRSAVLARNQEALLTSAAKCRDLRPDNESITRYAAALLVNQAQPAEAITLTLALLAQFPDSPAAVLNHVHALLQNNRLAEAQSLLDSLPQSNFTPEHARAYNLALLEICFRSADLPRALTVSRRINPAELFPSQRKRFEEIRRHLMLHAIASPSSQGERLPE